jgi:hypothetical protein
LERDAIFGGRNILRRLDKVNAPDRLQERVNASQVCQSRASCAAFGSSQGISRPIS